MMSTELDALFSASRQVEASLSRERARAEKLQAELSDIQNRYAREMGDARQITHQQAERLEETRKQLVAYHSQLQSVTAEARRLAKQLADVQENEAEKNHKIRLDLEITKAAMAHAQKQTVESEKGISESKIKMEMMRREVDKSRSDIADREAKYKSTIQAQQEHQQSLQLHLSELKGELTRYKDSWAEASRIQASAADDRKRLADAHLKIRELSEALATEKRSNNSEPLLANIREADTRRSRAESRMADMQDELARLKAEARAREMRNARIELDFEELERLAIVGHPTSPSLSME